MKVIGVDIGELLGGGRLGSGNISERVPSTSKLKPRD